MWTRVGGLLTGITMGLVGKARKGFALTRVLWQGGWGLWCHRARSGITWPHPMEHEVQPHQGDQHQLVEKESRDHGKTPSCKCRNEGILPGFQTTGISRRQGVHDQLTYDFRVDGMENQIRVMEHLADRVLPTAAQLG